MPWAAACRLHPLFVSPLRNMSLSRSARSDSSTVPHHHPGTASHPKAPHSGPKLRLFTTFDIVDDQTRTSEHKDKTQGGLPAPAQLGAGSHRWGPLHALSARCTLPEEQLLLSIAGKVKQQEACIEQQVVPFFQWYSGAYAAALASPCLGVPGLLEYVAARSRWIASQLQLAVDGDGCRQIVTLGAGFKTENWQLQQDGVQVKPTMPLPPHPRLGVMVHHMA